MRIPFAMPFLGEEEATAVAEVVRSGWVGQGEQVRQFEAEFAKYVGAREAVAVANGTVALHLAMVCAGVGPRDEVIVPSFTFVATVNAVLYQGATPVFVDIDPETFNISPEDTAHKVTGRTKAMVPVHYGGQIADMDPIMEIARQHRLLVVEDAAEAHGARYKGRHAGTFGEMAIFSFTPTKNMTTGEGGMLVTHNPELAERLRMLRNHGMDAPYHHVMLGYNYRMTDMQAALGRVQLKRLDEILERKREIAARYSQAFSDVNGIVAPFVAPYTDGHGYMLYTIKVQQDALGISRDELQAFLADREIETKVCFPPVHAQPYYRTLGYGEGLLPVTERISRQVLSLPCYARLTGEEVEYVGKVVRESLSASCGKPQQ